MCLRHLNTCRKVPAWSFDDSESYVCFLKITVQRKALYSFVTSLWISTHTTTVEIEGERLNFTLSAKAQKQTKHNSTISTDTKLFKIIVLLVLTTVKKSY